ncbi:MAG: hypothetical protein LBD62_04630 [Candidatus Margulisbacteria bacterium]|jgi:uncharacterized protein (DUF4415 family)|nr:hypothetical protein [Candidatus Margulisiibacteriota bacterium]
MVSHTLKQIKKMKSLTNWKKVDSASISAVETFTDDDLKTGRVKLVGKGLPAVQKYLAQRGRPKKEFPKDVINIAFERRDLLHLRALGRGWQTRLREYVEQGIAAGAL